MKDSNLYSLQEIHFLLDESFGRAVEIRGFFSDTKKYVKSVVKLQRTVGLDELNEKKRFRLRKLLTKLRKRKGSFKKKNRKMSLINWVFFLSYLFLIFAVFSSFVNYGAYENRLF